KGLRRRENKGGQNQVDDPKANIGESPAQCGELAPAPRLAEFPGRDGKQAADYEDKTYQRCLPSRIVTSRPAKQRAHKAWLIDRCRGKRLAIVRDCNERRNSGQKICTVIRKVGAESEDSRHRRIGRDGAICIVWTQRGRERRDADGGLGPQYITGLRSEPGFVATERCGNEFVRVYALKIRSVGCMRHNERHVHLENRVRAK